MLGFEDSGKLLRLLSAGEERTLDEIISEFNSSFPRSLHFYACSALDFLTTDPKENFLNPTQRLIALAFIHQAYASQPPSSNPFILKLVDAACDDVAEKYERAFILQLFSSTSMNGREFLKQSAADYIKNFDPSSHVSTNPSPSEAPARAAGAPSRSRRSTDVMLGRTLTTTTRSLPPQLRRRLPTTRRRILCVLAYFGRHVLQL